MKVNYRSDCPVASTDHDISVSTSVLLTTLSLVYTEHKIMEQFCNLGLSTVMGQK